MIKLRNILSVTAFLMIAVTLQAQTYNDSVRTRTWSVYMQGGFSGYHGVRSELFDNSRKVLSPDFDLGVKYNIRPWVRLGANAGYTMLKATGKHILSVVTTDDNFMIDNRPGTLEVKSDRLQNRNGAHLLGLDINADFNILQIWPKRKAQWLNLYAGAGVGYMHGWNRNSQTWSYNERGTAIGDAYNHLYTHSYMKSTEGKKQFNALYIPLSLSLEFDVLRQLTVGVIGQYKCLPTKAEFTPKGIYSAGVVVRYNFVKSKNKLRRNQVADLYSRLDAARVDCADEKDALQRQSVQQAQQLRGQVDELKRQLGEASRLAGKKKEEASAVIYFENNSYELSAEDDEKLRTLAGQLKADSEKKIMLIGSANAVGSKSLNRKLSSRRVEAVKQILLDQGVDEARFKTQVSLGDSGMTTSPDCRRVIVVTQP